MPVHLTTKAGKPAFQWGEHGAKYPYTPGNPESREKAREKAQEQGRAILSTGWSEDGRRHG